MSDQEQRKGTIYAIATIGARTERGGHVTRVSSKRSVCGLHIALVGDIVTYRDGSEAAITDGAGSRGVQNGRCVALVVELTLQSRTQLHTKVAESIERRNSRGERYFSALWGCFSL